MPNVRAGHKEYSFHLWHARSVVSLLPHRKMFRSNQMCGQVDEIRTVRYDNRIAFARIAAKDSI